MHRLDCGAARTLQLRQNAQIESEWQISMTGTCEDDGTLSFCAGMASRDDLASDDRASGRVVAFGSGFVETSVDISPRTADTLVATS